MREQYPSPSRSSAADEAWFWLKHILCSGWLCIASRPALRCGSFSCMLHLLECNGITTCTGIRKMCNYGILSLTFDLGTCLSLTSFSSSTEGGLFLLLSCAAEIGLSGPTPAVWLHLRLGHWRSGASWQEGPRRSESSAVKTMSELYHVLVCFCRRAPTLPQGIWMMKLTLSSVPITISLTPWSENRSDLHISRFFRQHVLQAY